MPGLLKQLTYNDQRMFPAKSREHLLSGSFYFLAVFIAIRKLSFYVSLFYDFYPASPAFVPEQFLIGSTFLRRNLYLCRGSDSLEGILTGLFQVVCFYGYISRLFTVSECGCADGCYIFSNYNAGDFPAVFKSLTANGGYFERFSANGDRCRWRCFPAVRLPVNNKPEGI